MLLLLCAAAQGGSVKLTTADGATLTGESWGRGDRGVLLVHDEARTRADWDLLAPKLAQAGFWVLAIDLRGHGGSNLAALPDPADWTEMVGDVAAGVAWLAANGAAEIHLVGDRLGANLALSAASVSEQVTDLVLVSPSLNHRGVRVSVGVTGLGERSVLVVAGADDPMAVKAGRWIAEQAAGPSRVEQLPSAGSGVRLLNAAPEAVNLLVGWIDGGADREVTGAAGDGPELRTGEVGEIETTGTRLEDRRR